MSPSPTINARMRGLVSWASMMAFTKSKGPFCSVIRHINATTKSSLPKPSVERRSG